MAGGYGYDYYPPAHYYPPPPTCGDYGYPPPVASNCCGNSSNVSVVVNGHQQVGRPGCNNGWCASPRGYPYGYYDYPLK